MGGGFGADTPGGGGARLEAKCGFFLGNGVRQSDFGGRSCAGLGRWGDPHPPKAWSDECIYSSKESNLLLGVLRAVIEKAIAWASGWERFVVPSWPQTVAAIQPKHSSPYGGSF